MEYSNLTLIDNNISNTSAQYGGLELINNKKFKFLGVCSYFFNCELNI